MPKLCEFKTKKKNKKKKYKQAITKSKHIFELLHMDLVGPLPELLYGNKYLFTFLDDYSRYGWTLFFFKNPLVIHLIHFYRWFFKY